MHSKCPKMGQDTPKKVPRWPKMVQDGSKMGPGWSQYGPSWSQVGPRCPKMSRKMSQDVPRFPRMSRKMSCKMSPRCPKMRDCPTICPTSSRCSPRCVRNSPDRPFCEDIYFWTCIKVPPVSPTIIPSTKGKSRSVQVLPRTSIPHIQLKTLTCHSFPLKRSSSNTNHHVSVARKYNAS